MKTQNQKKHLAGIFIMAALSCISSQAYAMEEVALGMYAGDIITSEGRSAAKKSWADSIARSGGFGWVHTGSSLAKLQVGTDADIANGVTYDVGFKMTATGIPGISSMDNPGFSIWTSGASDFEVTNVSKIGWHLYNQVVGPGLETSWNYALTQLGVTDFIGYINSGATFTNDDGNFVGAGGVNNSTPWVTNSAASSWVSTNTDGLDYALLTVMGLKSGYYLIAAGGSCFDQTCTNGGSFKWDITGSASPVPVPGAVWLFGSAIVGLIGVSQRKRSE